MSYSVIFHPEVLIELRESVDWYADAAGKELAASFTNLLQQATRSISANPYRFPVLEPDVRHLVLKRFPFSIIYTIIGASVLIVAVFHQRRDPDDWRIRL